MTNALQSGVEAYERGDYARALELFSRSLAVSHSNLAMTMQRLGVPGVEQHFRAALSAYPDEHEAAFGLGTWLLREGRYEEGWPLYERRRNIPRLQKTVIPAHWPEWRGEPLDGRRLAVIPEQGLGDQIMFARFVPELRFRGGDPVLYYDRSLARLLGGAHTTVRRQDFDLWCLQASLPSLLALTLETIPPPASLPVAWRGGSGIGVFPTGNPAYLADADRSLGENVGAALLALGRDLRPEATGARDFYETTEIVAGLDLVVTVDTSMAHLAGSMGVPTWVLLPSPFSDWRWLRDRADSPWYPSVRLFRQKARGDWRSVLDDVMAALRAEARL